MTLSSQTLYRWGIFPLWLLLTTTIFFRQPIPIDETRYLTVAWEMWLRGDFQVPYLNGHTYSHKPPLLFWLFHAGWAVFGVNDWWPRLVGPLCALLNLVLTRQLAAKLWPNQVNVALLAPWILIASLLWTLFATSTMFDILLTSLVLLAMLGFVEVVKGAELKGWTFVALSIGLGLLAKGPVIFLHILPTAALMVVWAGDEKVAVSRWFVGLLFATLIALMWALAWAMPAAVAGGEEYAKAILWHQTADRTVGTNIHKRPVFWYLPFLPMFLFPWLFWSRFWSGVKAGNVWGDLGSRFCLVWLTSIFIIFSLLPSKQIHYLIPMLPAFALLVAKALLQTVSSTQRQISEWLLPLLFVAIGVFLMLLPQVPGLSKWAWVQAIELGWGLSVLAIGVVLNGVLLMRRQLNVMSVAIAVVVAIFVGFICFFKYNDASYNLQPAALQVKAFNDQNVPVAFVGNYQGQLNFIGRLTQALPTLTPEQLADWSAQHSNGYLISLEKDRPVEAFLAQGHREYWLIFRPAAQFALIKPL
jgi:4-amino-4-deoxy-L-arabinose transferase-like glycosyltransferase